ncbi:MAG: hypothetical protein MUO76_04480, partial [Anaerolineaceae bacterium]|nr:hypothetical protein [Anaerolineaceae bacterium]
NIKIVQHEDFHLWKDELNLFSKIDSIEQQHQSLRIEFQNFLYDPHLHNNGIVIDAKKIEQWVYVSELMTMRITPSKRLIFDISLS